MNEIACLWHRSCRSWCKKSVQKTPSALFTLYYTVSSIRLRRSTRHTFISHSPTYSFFPFDTHQLHTIYWFPTQSVISCGTSIQIYVRFFLFRLLWLSLRLQIGGSNKYAIYYDFYWYYYVHTHIHLYTYTSERIAIFFSHGAANSYIDSNGIWCYNLFVCIWLQCKCIVNLYYWSQFYLKFLRWNYVLDYRVNLLLDDVDDK